MLVANIERAQLGARHAEAAGDAKVLHGGFAARTFVEGERKEEILGWEVWHESFISHMPHVTRHATRAGTGWAVSHVTNRQSVAAMDSEATVT